MHRHVSNDPIKDTGTSPMKTMTAGLVAYFLSLRNCRLVPLGEEKSIAAILSFLTTAK